MNVQTRSDSKIIPFRDGDETIRVRLTKHAGKHTNHFFAIEEDNRELFNFPIGYGDTEMSAIADLFEKMPRAASEREERDRMADHWDHQRDLRKNGGM